LTFYTTNKIAELMEVHPETVRRWIRNKDLNAIKIGKGKQCKYKIKKEDFEKFLDEKSTKKVN